MIRTGTNPACDIAFRLAARARFPCKVSHHSDLPAAPVSQWYEGKGAQGERGAGERSGWATGLLGNPCDLTRLQP
jgi:hypothetical protein